MSEKFCVLLFLQKWVGDSTYNVYIFWKGGLRAFQNRFDHVPMPFLDDSTVPQSETSIWRNRILSRDLLMTPKVNGSDAQHFSCLQCTSPMMLLSSTLRFGLFTMNHISHHRASPIISSTQSGYRAAIEKEFSPQWRSCAQIFSLKFAKANKI